MKTRFASWLLVIVLLSGCAHTAVYRTAGPAEPIARRVCFEVGGGGNVELAPGTLRCVILHGLKFEVRFAGDTLRVEAADAWSQTEVALHLGKICRDTAKEVTLVEFK